MNRRQFIAGLLASAAVAPAVVRGNATTFGWDLAAPGADRTVLTIHDINRARAALERANVPPLRVSLAINGGRGQYLWMADGPATAGDLVPGEWYAFPVHPAIVEALRDG